MIVGDGLGLGDTNVDGHTGVPVAVAKRVAFAIMKGVGKVIPGGH